MGAILYHFDSVPEAVDAETFTQAQLVAAKERHSTPDGRGALAVLQQRSAYLGVYEDLAHRKLPLPSTPAEQISRADLVAHLQGVLGEVVRAELDGDAHGLYKGRGHGCSPDKAEQKKCPHDAAHCGHAHAFSKHREDKDGREIPSRLSALLRRFPYAPNILTADDIAAARSQ